MVTKASLRRERREKRSRIRATVFAVVTVLIGSALFVLPRTAIWIAVDLFISFVASLLCAWHCWGLVTASSESEATEDEAKPFAFRWHLRTVFTVVQAVAYLALGWMVWPGIKVSPVKVSFSGFANETFNFSARNERSDDVYDVQIPFLIGYGKHLDEKITARVYPPSGDPPEYVTEDYSYCYGRGPDIHKVLPDEREVLIVKIPHLAPNAISSFTITYTGGSAFETQSGSATFVDAPYSYSPSMARTGVRGDYRICKFVGKVGR